MSHDLDNNRELFWVERPGDLLTHFSLIPLPCQSRETKFNAITRLFLILIIVLALLRVKKWGLILVIGLLIIVVVYYNTKRSTDKEKQINDTKEKEQQKEEHSHMSSKESYRPPILIQPQSTGRQTSQSSTNRSQSPSRSITTQSGQQSAASSPSSVHVSRQVPVRRQKISPEVASSPAAPILPSNEAVYNAREAVMRTEKDKDKKDKIESTIPKAATPAVALRTGTSPPYSFKSRGKGRVGKITMDNKPSSELPDKKVEYKHKGESSQVHECKEDGIMRIIDDHLKDDREQQRILARIEGESLENGTLNIVYS